MKMVADENLALMEYFFADMADIKMCSGRNLSHVDVMSADALMVRSVTAVNHALLNQSNVQFVGTATIGTDHLDMQALQELNIAWANAPGCNAQAVAEYVITAILTLQPQQLRAGQQFCLGIIGLGNVGTRLAKLAALLGWRIIGHDPYVHPEQDVTFQHVSLTQLLQQADAVSLHVPLSTATRYPTYHLMNCARLAQMKPKAILINSARGAVVEEAALLADLAKSHRPVVLDVFEFEPEITESLLSAVALVTPHIAGYSLEGKAKGTQMIYQAFCQYFQLAHTKDYRSQLPQQPDYFSGLSLTDALAQYLPQIYPILRDDAALRACLKQGKIHAADFDNLRKTYPLRREWAAFAGPSE